MRAYDVERLEHLAKCERRCGTRLSALIARAATTTPSAARCSRFVTWHMVLRPQLSAWQAVHKLTRQLYGKTPSVEVHVIRIDTGKGRDAEGKSEVKVIKA